MPSGLKEGGHHRRALDVAAKKRAQKKSQKEAQITAGRTKVILEKLLALDHDAELYLEDPEGRPMCADYFRFDRCANRRCKFSHEHSIADAVVAGNVTGNNLTTTQGANKSSAKDKDHNSKDSGGGSMIAVEKISSLYSRSTQPNTRRIAMDPPTPGAAGTFGALPEITIAVVASFFDTNADIGNLTLTCRYLRLALIHSKEVNRRRSLVLDTQLAKRNERLQKKSTAARLQFAVSYANNNNNDKDKPTSTSKGKKKSGRGGISTGPRPILAYDFENPQAFAEFEASYLASSLATKAQI